MIICLQIAAAIQNKSSFNTKSYIYIRIIYNSVDVKNAFLILLTIAAVTVRGQIADTVNYTIKQGMVDHRDCTAYYTERGQYLCFYVSDKGEKSFRNTTADGTEYSYGTVADIKIKETIEKKCRVENISFRWKFYNSYDSDTGFALVRLKRVHLLHGVEFNFKIITENKKQTIEFYGYTNEIKGELQAEKGDEENYCYK